MIKVDKLGGMKFGRSIWVKSIILRFVGRIGCFRIYFYFIREIDYGERIYKFRWFL